MRAESANPNHRVAPLPSRATVSLSWYDSTSTPTLTYAYTLTHTTHTCAQHAYYIHVYKLI